MIVPEDYVTQTSFGVLFRRQVYSDYLFLELEPSIGRRKLNPGDDYQFVKRIILRLEIAISRDPPRLFRN